jgi:hypothetical protein
VDAQPAAFPRLRGRAASLAPGGLDRAKHDYPCNLEILQDATHVIVHSDYARQLARLVRPGGGQRLEPGAAAARRAARERPRAARRALGIADDAFVVCNFGFVAPTKHCLELLQAWLASRLHTRCAMPPACSSAPTTAATTAARSRTRSPPADVARVRISGWTSDDDYLRYLQAADVGVQLRTGSRGETSGTVLDCMIYGLP